MRIIQETSQGLRAAWLVAAVVLGLATQARGAETILFIGNSFTYGEGSPVQHYHPETVTDLNKGGIGGVPALFKMFTVEARRDYTVSLETFPGVGLDYHLAHKAVLLRKPWDNVVMHGYSTLDQRNPGNPALLIQTVEATSALLRQENAKVQIWLLATWSRADLTYPEGRPWHGRPIEAMAQEIRTGYDGAAQKSKVRGVIPVGEAWDRAIAVGVADPNPYDGITAGQIDLWGKDHYHASTYGYYLDALVVFGEVTGLDPNCLGKTERAARELAIDPSVVEQLEKIAHDELSAPSNHVALKEFPPAVQP